MADLAHVLRHLPRRSDANLLAGTALGDDAAIYRLRDDLALVQTVDFFTPIVDDPYLFGQIAAANSLSDVYAVGGTPLTALNIVSFPVGTLPDEVLESILRGGADKAAEAGVTIVGGHTVEDDEPKYGLAVTGTVHPERFFTGRGARPGDVLVLTKPLGTGVIATALKAGEARPDDVTGAVRWMTRLSRDAAEAMVRAGAHAVSDVTGFGLLGHLVELCRTSAVSAVLNSARIPLLPGAPTYAKRGFMPGGTGKNRQAVEQEVAFSPAVDDVWNDLLYDPQTSGGLLIALSPGDLPRYRAAAGAHDLTVVIGEVVRRGDRAVSVEP